MVSKIHIPKLSYTVVEKATEPQRLASLAIFYDIHKDDQYKCVHYAFPVTVLFRAFRCLVKKCMFGCQGCIYTTYLRHVYTLDAFKCKKGQ